MTSSTSKAHWLTYILCRYDAEIWGSHCTWTRYNNTLQNPSPIFMLRYRNCLLAPLSYFSYGINHLIYCNSLQQSKAADLSKCETFPFTLHSLKSLNYGEKCFLCCSATVGLWDCDWLVAPYPALLTDRWMHDRATAGTCGDELGLCPCATHWLPLESAIFHSWSLIKEA